MSPAKWERHIDHTSPYHKRGEKVSRPSQYPHPKIPIQKTTEFKGMTQLKNTRSRTRQPRSLVSAQVRPLQNRKASTHRSGLERKRLRYISIHSIPSRGTDPKSPPAIILYYKSRDYQPQHSRLSLLIPDLKPPSGTASSYESSTNIC